MPLYYITGSAGSGKSSVQRELKQSGYDAYDTDDPEIGSAHNKQANRPVKIPPVYERSAEWFAEHSWKLFPAAIVSLREQSQNKIIFLCGSAANEHELINLFNDVFYLVTDEETLRRRISHRNANDFGKSEAELQSILERHRNSKQKYEKSGAIMINATQPTNKVVNEILSDIKG